MKSKSALSLQLIQQRHEYKTNAKCTDNSLFSKENTVRKARIVVSLVGQK